MLFRRVPTVIAWWDDGEFRVQNYATLRTSTLDAESIAVATVLNEWRSKAELAARFPQYRRRLSRTLGRLEKQQIIETSDRRPRPREVRMSGWDDWSPAASFFHFTTKDVEYIDRRTSQETLALWEATDDVPAPTKRMAGSRVDLPPFDRRGAFPSVLLARRSWRRFGTGRTTLRQLATILGLTWGTQNWIRVGKGRLPLKTSPSGGCLHSLEAYAVVLSVGGLRTGLYHYDSDAHALVRLADAPSRRWITTSLGRQNWFGKADALVFMTSVFPRVQWKYRFARAYRIVLLEAGHFCQTFCLTATWLGLAPFCTAALADRVIERRLGVDGIHESVLYAMGVGTRPAATGWAPWPNRDGAPRTTPPAYAQRVAGMER
jgi:SagB-type dehydrogenase family enzyme